MKFLKLNTDLTTEEVEVNPFNTYESIRESVDGPICSVHGYFQLPRQIYAWGNDEALYRDDFQTLLLFKHDMGDGIIKGPVVFSRISETGQTLGLTDEDIELLKFHLSMFPHCMISEDGENWEEVLFVDLREEETEEAVESNGQTQGAIGCLEA